MFRKISKNTLDWLCSIMALIFILLMIIGQLVGWADNILSAVIVIANVFTYLALFPEGKSRYRDIKEEFEDLTDSRQ